MEEKEDVAGQSQRKRVRVDDDEHQEHKENGVDHNDGGFDTESHVPLKLTPIFGRAELDDTVKQICDFIYKYGSSPNIEIEAKIGMILSKESRERIWLPIVCETCVMQESDPWFSFQSELPVKVFQMFNNKLNERVVVSQKGGSGGPPPVIHRHFKERDVFYSDGIRVSLNEQGEVLRKVRKKRLADLNIYCPNRHFDYRISISTETEVPDKPQGRLLFERHKERVSYRHEIFSFDLTTVDTIRDSQRKVTYEMEIEIADMKRLFHERDRLHHGAPNNFSRIIQALREHVHSLLSVVGSRGLSPVVVSQMHHN